MKDDNPVINWIERLVLDDGDSLVECVEADGSTSLWVIRPLCAQHEAEAVHGDIADAPHEQLGRLPVGVRRRLGLTGTARPVVRCGRPCLDGRECRAQVYRVGDACRHHRDHHAGEAVR